MNFRVTKMSNIKLPSLCESQSDPYIRIHNLSFWEIKISCLFCLDKKFSFLKQRLWIWALALNNNFYNLQLIGLPHSLNEGSCRCFLTLTLSIRRVTIVTRSLFCIRHDAIRTMCPISVKKKCIVGYLERKSIQTYS